MEWKQYGVLHREDGPAVIRPERNEKEWYWKGARHREDGPAVITEMRDGDIHYSWYLREKCVSKEEVFRSIPRKDREKRREFIKEWGV